MGQTSSFWGDIFKKVFSPRTTLSVGLSRIQRNSKILFVGNPGVGKSTMLNSLVQRVEFHSGMTTGRGFTRFLKEVDFCGLFFVDTPGLSDIHSRVEAAEEIRKALMLDGMYFLVFVVNIVSGRVRPEDSTTMKVVLDALVEVQDLTYGIIISKVEIEEIEFFQQPADDHKNFRELVANLNHDLPRTTTDIHFYPREPSAVAKSNFLLPRNPHLESFIANLQPVTIQQAKVKQLNIDSYDTLLLEMVEKAEKLQKDKSNLLALLQQVQKNHIETVQILEKQIKDLQMRLAKFEDAEKAAVSSGSEKQISLYEQFKPDSNIHESVCRGIGDNLWYSKPWQEVYATVKRKIPELIEKYSIGRNNIMTIDMVLALTYYTSDLRVFGGTRENSLFYLINSDLRECSDFNKLVKWNDFLWYAFEASKHMTKYVERVYRAVEKPLSELSGEYNEGKEVKYTSFTSCSKNESLACTFKKGSSGTIMIFDVIHSGIDLSDLSLFPEEVEVLFLPGATFMVKSIDVSGPINYVHFIETK